jgi:hypothetical protein
MDVFMGVFVAGLSGQGKFFDGRHPMAQGGFSWDYGGKHFILGKKQGGKRAKCGTSAERRESRDRDGGSRRRNEGHALAQRERLEYGVVLVVFWWRFLQW